ncbi:hypothetical protein [Streptomyces sp. NRRL WC-3618]|nr:hypothetical protein [Streptomyces sp. NRRL WC-3618]
MGDRPLTPEQPMLGDDMKRRWAAFDRTGTRMSRGRLRGPLSVPRTPP